jgi:CRP/FNR family transcriptional regulator, dissimilatory nitrate respiration regulator
MTHSTETRIDTEALLARMPLFQDLPHERILELAEHSRGKRLPKGEMLFQKGDPAHGFYVVVYGQVKLAFPSSSGNEKVVDIIGAQQSFGEAVMLAQHVYPVFAQALADTLLVFVSREAVFALLENEPAFARRMLIGLAMHNHSLVHDIESYTLRTSAQRVIGYLLEHCPRECSALEAIEIHLPTSKQITASRLNLTPETLSRIFHDLMEAGLIDMVGKRIRIHSIQRLRDAIAHDSPDGGLLAAISTRPRADKRPQHASPGKPADARRRAAHAQPADLTLEHRVTASW